MHLYLRLFLLSISLLVIASCQASDVQQTQTTNAPLPAHHTKNGFKNLYTAPIGKGIFSFLKMRFFGDEPFSDQASQAHTIPIAKPEFNKLLQPGDQAQITWLGHSSFLIQYKGLAILTDPILSMRASPLSFIGPKRLVDMPITLKDLPEIDFVIISHDHYDHLDKKTIQTLGSHPRYLVPLKLKDWFIDVGIDAAQVEEFDWWDNRKFTTLNVTATPSQHWSARRLFDRYSSLWAAWHIEIDDFSLWFAGDTGYNDIQFKEIGDKFTSIDLALIPIGAYAPRWFMKQQHVNPEEAIQIHKDIGAKKSIGMHWGTFQLTAEPIREPVERLEKAVNNSLLQEGEFTTLAIGETLFYSPEASD